MSEVFDSLSRSLLQAIQIEKGIVQMEKHKNTSLPAPTYVQKESRNLDKITEEKTKTSVG